MNHRNQSLLLPCVLIFLINACSLHTEYIPTIGAVPTPQVAIGGAGGINDGNCIPAQYSFAYLTKTNDSINNLDQQKIMPPDPWQLELMLPDLPNNAITGRSKDWLLSVFSKSSNSYEVWVLRSWTDELASGSDYKFMEILMYSSEKKEWKSVPIQVQGTSAVVGELFMTSDGTIWAQNYSGSFISTFEPPLHIGVLHAPQDTLLTDIPLLSKYNKLKNRFEPDYNMENLPSSKFDDEWSKVLLDKNGMFWIFIQKDGIYSYNPFTQTINRHVEFPENYTLIKSVALASDGSIFFSDDFSSVSRFNPKTDKLTQISGSPLPFENSYNLYFHNILVDHQGRLWLGDVGWAEPDKYTSWYQLVPSPVFITDKVENLPIHQWERPWLLLESSDGLLWYKSSNGMVWLDPQKEKWCWFTTEQSNIVEDQQLNLWMIADDKLYKYPLNQ
jgi:hypothetical protein